MLTPGQEKVLAFIARHTGSLGYPPTMREITEHIGAKSTNAAHCYLQGLAARGAIVRTARASRAIAITAEGRAYLEHVAEASLARRQLG
jgi:SOS-response transcriptional repressor LexA